MVGPPKPNTEASQKQTYVPGQEFVRIYKPKTFTSEVKVVPLTYYEELLIRNRAMYPILCYGYILYIVFLVKPRRFLGLKRPFLAPIITSLLQTAAPFIRCFCSKTRRFLVYFVVNRAIFRLKRQSLA